jgi:hypothetical protein
MALREAGERQHDNAGGSRKLSAVSAGHSMRVTLSKCMKVIEIIILLLLRDGNDS